ncbi:MAG TPA: hypothetical protein PLV68_20260, partial [Ilumatobacteraceae bacterium]|nr:hypothetical protein [Ilumatobacteraceae bacterium]
PDVTRVLTEDGLQSSELDVITQFLGEVTFEDPRFVYPLIDVVVVVGKSYLADMADARDDKGDTAGTDAGAGDGGGDPRQTSA